jgi:hypothetical protein
VQSDTVIPASTLVSPHDAKSLVSPSFNASKSDLPSPITQSNQSFLFDENDDFYPPPTVFLSSNQPSSSAVAASFGSAVNAFVLPTLDDYGAPDLEQDGKLVSKTDMQTAGSAGGNVGLYEDDERPILAVPALAQATVRSFHSKQKTQDEAQSTVMNQNAALAQPKVTTASQLLAPPSQPQKEQLVPPAQETMPVKSSSVAVKLQVVLVLYSFSFFFLLLLIVLLYYFLITCCCSVVCLFMGNSVSAQVEADSFDALFSSAAEPDEDDQFMQVGALYVLCLFSKSYIVVGPENKKGLGVCVLLSSHILDSYDECGRICSKASGSAGCSCIGGTLCLRCASGRLESDKILL